MSTYGLPDSYAATSSALRQPTCVYCYKYCVCECAYVCMHVCMYVCMNQLLILCIPTIYNTIHMKLADTTVS